MIFNLCKILLHLLVYKKKNVFYKFVFTFLQKTVSHFTKSVLQKKIDSYILQNLFLTFYKNFSTLYKIRFMFLQNLFLAFYKNIVSFYKNVNVIQKFVKEIFKLHKNFLECKQFNSTKILTCKKFVS